MIDALARSTATLRSKLLRHIPAPQTTSGLAEVRHKTIAYRVVKCECCSLWQEHLRSGNASKRSGGQVAKTTAKRYASTRANRSCFYIEEKQPNFFILVSPFPT